MKRVCRVLCSVLLAAAGPAQDEPPEVVLFDNGVRFAALERDDTPLVTFAVSMARDLRVDAVESALDEVLARTLLASTGSDGEALRTDLAMQWSVELDTSRVHFVVSVPRASATQAAQLLVELFEDPFVDRAELARVREEVADLAARRLAHPFWVAEDEITRQVVSGPGRAVLLQPVPVRVRALGLEVLLDRARDWRRGRGTTVCVVGAPPDGFADTFRAGLGGWSDEPAPEAPTTQPASGEPGVVAVPVAGQEVVHLRIGRARPAHPGSEDLAAWAADRVADRAIASGFTSLLVETLRGEHGLIYGAGVLQVSVPGQSAAAITTSCTPAALPEVLRRTRRTLEMALKNGLSVERFLSARNTLWVEWAQAFETAEGLCRAMDRGLIDSGDPLLWQRRLRAIELVDPQDFERSVRAFAPSGLTVVCAGAEAPTGSLTAAWENP